MIYSNWYVYNIAVAKKFLRTLPNSRRIDVFGCFDSNGFRTPDDGESGHTDGLKRAYHNFMGLYADQVGTNIGTNSLNVSTGGWSCGFGGNLTGSSDSEADLESLPEYLKRYLFKRTPLLSPDTDYAGPHTPFAHAAFFPSDIGSGTNPKLSWAMDWYPYEYLDTEYANNGHPFSDKPYEMRMVFFKNPVGSGVGRCWPNEMRSNNAGRRWGQVSTTGMVIPEIDSSGEESPFVDITFTVGLNSIDSADTRPVASGTTWSSKGGIHKFNAAVTGTNGLETPVILCSARPVLPYDSAPSGIGFNLGYFQGGLGAVELSKELQVQTQEALSEAFRRMCKDQETTKEDEYLLFHIIHGGNDRNDSISAFGPNGTSHPLGFESNTFDGHYWNLKGIIDYVTSGWVADGRPENNLGFCLGPYHPQSSEFGETKYLEFDGAWRSLCNEYPERVFALLAHAGSTAQDFISSGVHPTLRPYGWYNEAAGSLDEAHLTRAGYREWHNHQMSLALRTIDAWDSGSRSYKSFLNKPYFSDPTLMRTWTHEYGNVLGGRLDECPIDRTNKIYCKLSLNGESVTGTLSGGNGTIDNPYLLKGLTEINEYLLAIAPGEDVTIYLSNERWCHARETLPSNHEGINLLEKSNYSIASWDGGPGSLTRPLISAFVPDSVVASGASATGWLQDPNSNGNTSVYGLPVELLSNVTWIKQNVRYGHEDYFNAFSRVNSEAGCQSKTRSFYKDTSNNLLLVNFGSGFVPTGLNEYEIAYSATQNKDGILVDEVDNIRLHNLEIEGFGVGEDTFNSPSCVNVHAVGRGAARQRVVLSDIKAFYGGTHCIKHWGINSGNYGGAITLHNCEWGLGRNNPSGTRYIGAYSYMIEGGQEAIFNNCSNRYGPLVDENITSANENRGYALAAEASGNNPSYPLDLFIAYGCNHYSTTGNPIRGGSFANHTQRTSSRLDLANISAFVVNEKVDGANQDITTTTELGGRFGGRIAYINCIYDNFKVGGETIFPVGSGRNVFMNNIYLRPNVQDSSEDKVYWTSGTQLKNTFDVFNLRMDWLSSDNRCKFAFDPYATGTSSNVMDNSVFQYCLFQDATPTGVLFVTGVTQLGIYNDQPRFIPSGLGGFNYNRVAVIDNSGSFNQISGGLGNNVVSFISTTGSLNSNILSSGVPRPSGYKFEGRDLAFQFDIDFNPRPDNSYSIGSWDDPKVEFSEFKSLKTKGLNRFKIFGE